MTTHRGVFRTVVGSTGCLIGLILLVWPTGILQADTVVSLTWDANSEPDLAGYRIHYGTSPGSYTLPSISAVGQNNARTITNLQANTTYYFAVTAYDLAGNESPLSNEVAAQPTSTTLPTIVGALDLGSISLLDSNHLTASIIVSGSAILGPRSLRVTNPDGATASRPNTLTVVKTADVNRDCRIAPQLSSRCSWCSVCLAKARGAAETT